MDYKHRTGISAWLDILIWSAVGVFLSVQISIAQTLDADDASNENASTTTQDDVEVDFGREIQPLLSDRCYLCHGPDEVSREAGLRLDSFVDATEFAIVPGDAANSALLERIISADDADRMPPPGSHKDAFTPAEIELFRRWIKQGAEYKKHWAFLNPVKPSAPVVLGVDQQPHPIDAFILRRLRSKNMVPAKQADRKTLLRRAAFDLTGLPVTPQQVEAFVNDQRPHAQAWSSAIDRLMASPHYGEHQARLWLDAARYADTNGYQYDFNRDQWAWRDWVINSFNTNQPFDQFSIEQLAGDLLPDCTEQQRLATGFCRNHPITVEGGVIDEEYRTEYVIDRAVTAGTVWMGMTVQCARCHDHKYDPLSQKDFFQLTAFFNNVPEKGLRGFEPLEQIPSPMQAGAIDEVKRKVKTAQNKLRLMGENWDVDQGQLLADFVEANARTDCPVPVAQSLQGANMEVLGDNSVLVSGEKQKTDVYEIVLQSELPSIERVRLDVLTHKSLPKEGSSRSPNANFVLSEFEIEFAAAGQGVYQKVPLAGAEADYSKKRSQVALAADGKIDKNGWAVEGAKSKYRTDHYAIFNAQQAFGDSQGGRIKIRMHFVSPRAEHQIGRFKITLLASDPRADARLAVDAASKKPDLRTVQENDAILELLTRKYGNRRMKQAQQKLNDVRQNLMTLMDQVPSTMIMKERKERRKTYVLDRGQYDQPGAEVQPTPPQFLSDSASNYQENRLGFARWLMSQNNPLTSRVTVNRFWQQLFGIGLVDTPEDFGLQGAWPTHPELLDWLAVDFRSNDWDVKRLLKQIMMTDAYQRDSAVTPDQFAADPNNRWLARGARFRLDAEAIRDSALAVSAAMNTKIGGPSVFPYHPQGLWLEVNNRPGYSAEYVQDTGEKLYRRSLYTYWKRSVVPPAMAIFDAPAREYCQVRRSRTNTPLQAFVLLHDPQFVEAARRLAERMLQEQQTPKAQIQFGISLALGRQPTAQENDILLAAYKERLQDYQGDPDQATRALAVGESKPPVGLANDQLAALMDVARLILNLSEFVTRE